LISGFSRVVAMALDGFREIEIAIIGRCKPKVRPFEGAIETGYPVNVFSATLLDASR